MEKSSTGLETRSFVDGRANGGADGGAESGTGDAVSGPAGLP